MDGLHSANSVWTQILSARDRLGWWIGGTLATILFIVIGLFATLVIVGTTSKCLHCVRCLLAPFICLGREGWRAVLLLYRRLARICRRQPLLRRLTRRRYQRVNTATPTLTLDNNDEDAIELGEFLGKVRAPPRSEHRASSRTEALRRIAPKLRDD